MLAIKDISPIDYWVIASYCSTEGFTDLATHGSWVAEVMPFLLELSHYELRAALSAIGTDNEN